MLNGAKEPERRYFNLNKAFPRINELTRIAVS